MLKAQAVTSDNIDRLEPIYSRFSKVAVEKYQWSGDPVDFATLKQAVARRFVEGLFVEESTTGEPKAMMLFRMESHRAIEINVIYSEVEEQKSVIDQLMRAFIPAIREREGWDVVSYAMLGEQATFIRTILWYGFGAVGQAFATFDIIDPIGIQILRQQQMPELPEGYRMDSWKPEYAGGVAECVHEAFKDSRDARWDPRFRTEAGCRHVVAMMTQGVMGDLVASCTSVLLKGNQPVGFCFLLQTGAVQGNIPLIGVHPGEAGKGFGNQLLKNTMEAIVQGMLDETVAMTEVTTTFDTDSIPAIKMYRRMGFRESYHYPHSYLSCEKAREVKIGQWC